MTDKDSPSKRTERIKSIFDSDDESEDEELIPSKSLLETVEKSIESDEKKRLVPKLLISRRNDKYTSVKDSASTCSAEDTEEQNAQKFDCEDDVEEDLEPEEDPEDNLEHGEDNLEESVEPEEDPEDNLEHVDDNLEDIVEPEEHMNKEVTVTKKDVSAKENAAPSVKKPTVSNSSDEGSEVADSRPEIPEVVTMHDRFEALLSSPTKKEVAASKEVVEIYENASPDVNLNEIEDVVVIDEATIAKSDTSSVSLENVDEKKMETMELDNDEPDQNDRQLVQEEDEKLQQQSEMSDNDVHEEDEKMDTETCGPGNTNDLDIESPRNVEISENQEKDCISDEDRDIPDDDDGIREDEGGISEDDDGISEDDGGISENDGVIPEDDNGIPENAGGIPENKDSTGIQEDEDCILENGDVFPENDLLDRSTEQECNDEDVVMTDLTSPQKSECSEGSAFNKDDAQKLDNENPSTEDLPSTNIVECTDSDEKNAGIESVNDLVASIVSASPKSAISFEHDETEVDRHTDIKSDLDKETITKIANGNNCEDMENDEESYSAHKDVESKCLETTSDDDDIGNDERIVADDSVMQVDECVTDDICPDVIEKETVEVDLVPDVSNNIKVDNDSAVRRPENSAGLEVEVKVETSSVDPKISKEDLTLALPIDNGLVDSPQYDEESKALEMEENGESQSEMAESLCETEDHPITKDANKEESPEEVRTESQELNKTENISDQPGSETDDADEILEHRKRDCDTMLETNEIDVVDSSNSSGADSKKIRVEDVFTDSEDDTLQIDVVSPQDPVPSVRVDPYPKSGGVTEVSESRKRSSRNTSINLPAIMVAFEKGWHREIVYRSTEASSSSSVKSDVYYYAPCGKKLRSNVQVMDYLLINKITDLSSTNFTFFKEPLGVEKYEKLRLSKPHGGLNKKLSKVQQESGRENSSSPTPEVIHVPVDQPKTAAPTPNPPKLKLKRTEIVQSNLFSKPSPKIVRVLGNKQASAACPPSQPVVSFNTLPKLTPKSKKEATVYATHLFPCNPPLMHPRIVTPKLNGVYNDKTFHCTPLCADGNGLVPSLQCVKCYCLFHPECCQLPHQVAAIIQASLAKFLCPNCYSEKWSPAEHAPKAPPCYEPLAFDPTSSEDEGFSPDFEEERPKRKKYRQEKPKSNFDVDVIRDDYNTQFMGEDNFHLSTDLQGTPEVDHFGMSQPSDYDIRPQISVGGDYIDPGYNKELSPKIPLEPIPIPGVRGNQFFLSDFAHSYHVLRKVFSYLNVRDLLIASQVCHLWRDLAWSPECWSVVRLRNVCVCDWAGMVKFLTRRGTKELDLRKMVVNIKMEKIEEPEKIKEDVEMDVDMDDPELKEKQEKEALQSEQDKIKMEEEMKKKEEEERIEKEKREIEEQERLEKERIEKEEQERKEKDERERLEREENERKEKEDKERLEREERERIETEEREKKEREEMERIECVKKEQEEREQREREEQERKEREENEKKEKEEKERIEKEFKEKKERELKAKQIYNTILSEHDYFGRMEQPESSNSSSSTSDSDSESETESETETKELRKLKTFCPKGKKSPFGQQHLSPKLDDPMALHHMDIDAIVREGETFLEAMEDQTNSKHYTKVVQKPGKELGSPNSLAKKSLLKKLEHAKADAKKQEAKKDGKKPESKKKTVKKQGAKKTEAKKSDAKKPTPKKKTPRKANPKSPRSKASTTKSTEKKKAPKKDTEKAASKPVVKPEPVKKSTDVDKSKDTPIDANELKEVASSPPPVKVIDLKREGPFAAWHIISSSLASLPTLEKITVGPCEPDVIEILLSYCHNLTSITAMSIGNKNKAPEEFLRFDPSFLMQTRNMEEFRLASQNDFVFKSNFNFIKLPKLRILLLKGLHTSDHGWPYLGVNLTHLQLSSAATFNAKNWSNIGSMVNLTELCLDIGGTDHDTFLSITLPKIPKLKSLALFDCPVGPKFPHVLKRLTNIKKFHIIPSGETEFYHGINTGRLMVVVETVKHLNLFLWGILPSCILSDDNISEKIHMRPMEAGKESVVCEGEDVRSIPIDGVSKYMGSCWQNTKFVVKKEAHSPWTWVPWRI